MSTLLALFRPQSWLKVGSFGNERDGFRVDGRVGGGIDDAPVRFELLDGRRGGDPPPQLISSGPSG